MKEEVLQKAPVKVLIGLPFYDTIHHRTYNCVTSLLASVPIEWDMIQSKSANVPFVRNKIASVFMEHPNKPEYLFFIDSDMVFSPKDFVTLFKALRDSPEAGLMGGAYLKRDGSLTPLVGWLDSEGKPADRDVAIDKLVEGRGKVVEADLIPTGFMLIRREVFEKIPRPWFETIFPWRNDPDPEWHDEMWSSDNVFVQKVKEAGFKTLAHLGVEVGHCGEFVYYPEHFYAQAGSMTSGAMLAQVKYELGAAHGYQSREYWDGLWQAEKDMGRERDYPLLHQPIVAAMTPGWKVLDLGCGPGVLSEKLRDAGCEVTCMDLSETAVSICKDKGFQAERFDLDTDKPDPGWHGYFDAVVCTEVLEHVKDPVRAIKTIHAFLGSGGLAVVSTPDNCLPPEEEPEHVRTVTELGMRTWFQGWDSIDVVKIKSGIPLLLGFGVKRGSSNDKLE